MKKTLKARYEADQQVGIVLDKNASKYSQIPVMVTTVSLFKSLLTDIENLKVRIEKIPSKTAGNKNIARQDLVTIAYKIVSIIKVYAFVKKNKNLRNLLLHSESDLTVKLQHGQLLDFTKGLAEKVESLMEQLSEYGMTEELLQELKKEIEDFEMVITEPRQLISERKNTNELIENKIDEIQKLLSNQIDPFMELFTEDKEFYLAYKSARMIVDPATRKKEEEKTER